MFTDEIQLYLDDYQEKMQKSVDHLKDEYAKLRAGRANPKLVEQIKIDYYGTMTPIYQMAGISVPDPRTLMISPWDASMVRSILVAIDEAKLGLSPSDDGRNIRLAFPALTEERRKEMVKEISKLAETTKVSCRNERRDVLDVFKKMKNDKELSEDEFARVEKEVQSMIDDSTKNIDEIFARKQKELLEV